MLKCNTCSTVPLILIVPNSKLFSFSTKFIFSVIFTCFYIIVLSSLCFPFFLSYFFYRRTVIKMRRTAVESSFPFVLFFFFLPGESLYLSAREIFKCSLLFCRSCVSSQSVKTADRQLDGRCCRLIWLRYSLVACRWQTDGIICLALLHRASTLTSQPSTYRKAIT